MFLKVKQSFKIFPDPWVQIYLTEQRNWPNYLANGTDQPDRLTDKTNWTVIFWLTRLTNYMTSHTDPLDVNDWTEIYWLIQLTNLAE